MSQFILTIEAEYGKMHQTKIYVGQMSGKKYGDDKIEIDYDDEDNDDEDNDDLFKFIVVKKQ